MSMPSARAAATTYFQPCDVLDDTGDGSFGGLTQLSSTGASPTAAFARAMTSAELFHGAMR